MRGASTIFLIIWRLKPPEITPKPIARKTISIVVKIISNLKKIISNIF